MRQVAIRFGSEGKTQVVNDLREIGETGDRAFTRAENKARRLGEEAEAAAARAETAFRKVDLLRPGLNPTKLDAFAGVQEGARKSAEASFAVFDAAYRQMERRAEALRMAIDPIYAAQQRVNGQMAEARTLVAAGVLSLDDYAKAAWRSHEALDEMRGGQVRVGAQSSAMRSAMAGASYQVQDFVTQISMGANPIQAFVVQGGQLAGQFMNIEGKAGAVAKFLMGGWGLALQIGLMALGPLVAKLWESGTAADEARKATDEHRKAVLELANAERKAVLSAERRQAVTVATIKLQYDSAIAAREEAKALLEKAKAELALNNSPGAIAMMGEAAGEVQRQNRNRVADLERQMAEAQADVIRLRAGGEAAFARLVGMKVDARSSPDELVKSRYDRARMDAMRELAGDPNKLAERLRSLNATRDAELERIKKLEEAERKLGQVRQDSETLTGNAVAKMLMGVLPGVKITATTNGKHVAGSDHYANRAIDFVPAGGMRSMTKDDVRRIFTERGIEIRKNAAGVEQLFGPGDKGHDDHFHVAWTKGKFALDAFTDAAKRAKEEYGLLKGIVDDARGVDVGSLLDAENARRQEAIRKLVGDGDPLKVATGQELKAQDDAEREVERDRLARGKERIQQLADFYRTAFTNGTGSILAMFRQRGLEIISELLAKWTIGQAGGGGGLLGGLTKLLGAGKSAWAGSGGISDAGLNIANDVSSLAVSLPKLASGTEYWSGGAALLGEHGPERAWLPRGTRVTPAGDTRRMMAGNDNGARGDTHIHFYGEGAVLAETVRGWVAQGVQIAATQGAVGGARLSAADTARRGRRRIVR